MTGQNPGTLMDGTVFTQSLVGSLRAADVAVVVAALALLGLIAWRSGRRELDTRDFFLGNRQVPAFIACLSFIATEVSAITIVSVPATAFSENWNYLQFFIGSAAARVFVAFLFLPVFFRHECTSIYEFLRDRFNGRTQYAGSIFFFITRLIGSGVRLYAACLAIGILLNLPLGWTLLLFTVVSIAFIAFGGIKAVVWTGAYSAGVFYLAAAAVGVYLLTRIPQAGELLAAIGAQALGLGQGPPGELVKNVAGKLQIFNFSSDLNAPTSLWAGMANAFFVGLAVFGTDQELVQRLLTVRTRGQSQKAILLTLVAVLPMLLLYLAMGTLLYIVYQVEPALARPEQAKDVLPFFAANYLPQGLRGLVLAAVILASIDSPLSSLSSSFVTDIYRPLIRRQGSERHYLLVSRAGVVGFGLVLGLIAWSCQGVQNILWFAFQIISVTGGATLGVFLLGILVRRRRAAGEWVCLAALAAGAAALAAALAPGASSAVAGCLARLSATPEVVRRWLAVLPWLAAATAAPVILALLAELRRPMQRSGWGNVLAMTLSSLLMLDLLLLSKYGGLSLAWSWLIVIGTIVTFCLAYVFLHDEP